MLTFVQSFTTLDRIAADAQPRIGGKAFNCARLRQAGFPVPDGIIVPIDASDDELRALADDPWFDSAPAGTLYAVRSSGIGEDSAGHSFAGIHETQLNVTRAQVAEAVLVCRRSARSEHAAAYRRARDLENESAIGVLVQRMVPAVRSGVAFTVNPVTGANELVINAIDGLGEALVSGQVTPDELILSKTDRTELAQLLVAIEAHYGTPQDIEWCHDGTQYWIVQSRPITTITSPQSAIPDVEWTRANLAEVLPDQLSPQALHLYERALGEAERRFFGRLMAPESALGPIIKSFHGRLYFNLAQLRHASETVGAAFADTLRSLGHAEDIRPEDEVARRPPMGRLLRALPDLFRLIAHDVRAARIFRENERLMDAAVARLGEADPATLSDEAIWRLVNWWIDTANEAMTVVFVMSGVQAREAAIRKACDRVGFSYERLVYPQLAAGERSVSSQQAFDLVALANIARAERPAADYLRRNDGRFDDFRQALAGTVFLERFDVFLQRYGHRGRYESDWALPRLHEDPASTLFAIRANLDGESQDLIETFDRQDREAAAAWAEFEAALTPWQRWTLLPRVRSTVKRLKQQYVWREKVRSDLTRALARFRALHLELAARFVERAWIDRRDDYFLLFLDEVSAALTDAAAAHRLRHIAADRAASLAAERHLKMPLLMRESELPALLRRNTAAAVHQDGDLTGLCVSPGSVEADVVVMTDPSEFASMKRGAILVARATDPSWTALFTLASGVIVEVGGMLSHASTIAREYGLPALANVRGATTRLKTGDRVRLDASSGVVHRLRA